MVPLLQPSPGSTQTDHSDAAAQLYAALREEGPAFIATTGPGLVVGALAPLPPPTCWADVEFAWAGATRDAAGTGPALPSVVGFLSYEAGRWAQPVATLPGRGPDGWFGRCAGGWLFPRGAPPVPFGEATARPSRPRQGVPSPRGGPARWDSAAGYEVAVATALDHIREGDCYQVNLARGVTVDDPGDPLHAWLRLSHTNPARRSMLLDLGDRTLVSNSPELLLASLGRSLLSVPIKGTRPLDRPPGELLRNRKERAELTMIVDLVRADLANVARLRTVTAGPRRVGRVGHLWHAMQRVYGELDEGRTPVDALGALFPAGSVTGAPRVRATGIIRDLERGPRGAYCGTMGWFGRDGSATWNVAIRTMTFHGRHDRTVAATMHFGSGIVWGSDPSREREETEWKARRMLAAVCA